MNYYDYEMNLTNRQMKEKYGMTDGMFRDLYDAAMQIMVWAERQEIVTVTNREMGK